MPTLERAIEIAARAHAGQIDKAGEAYILHPLRVMLACRSTDAKIAGVLHDVVEDTTITLDQLRGEGFGDNVVTAVEHVTKREGEDYFDFVRRAMQHPIAREVKRADLVDNMDMSRIHNVTAKDHERLERYQKALRILDAE